MRCLHCGKELALLKRLTGGAEFCSEAHRKSYQSQYNDLALNRLMQAKPVPGDYQDLRTRKSVADLLPPREPQPQEAAPEPKTPANAVAKPAPAAKEPREDVEKLPAPPEPQPPEIIAAMWGPIVEQPVAAAPPVGEIASLEPLFETIPLTMPQRVAAVQTLPDGPGPELADAMKWAPPVASVAGVYRPKETAVTPREPSRGAPPVPPIHSFLGIEPSTLTSSGEDAMELRTQIRPPSGAATLWHAPAPPPGAPEIVLGALGRIDFAVEGFGQLTARPTAEPPVAPTPDVRPAEPVVQPLPITLHAIGGTPAQPSVIPVIASTVAPKTPAPSALPLRPVMVLGPSVKQAPRPVAVEPQKTHQAPQVVEVPAPAARVLRPSGKIRRADVRVTAVTPVRPTAQPVPAAPAPAAPEPVAAAPVEAPKVEVQKPVAAPPPDPAPLTAPVPEPIMAPSPVRSTLALAEAVAAPQPEIHLAMVEESFWSKLPGGVRVAIAATLALVIVGFAYYALNSSPASATPVAKAPELNYTVGSQINSGGWIEDWAPDDPDRRITLLRGSQPFSDYRMEFKAQIQNKALGWMYRGLNPRTFYVAKIEKLKNGLQPVVALVRYTVIDGKIEGRVEVPLPMVVRVDTTYKVRFDAVGPNFTVWVQDQQVAQWKDTRLGSGGLGLYAEGDETAIVQGNVDVFELTPNK